MAAKRSKALLWGMTCVAYVLLLTQTAAAESNRPAQVELKELQRQLLEAQSRITSWYIEYKSAVRDEPGKPPGAYLHRIVAARSPYHFLHWSAHGTANYSSTEDPLQQRMWIDEGTAFGEFPLDRVYYTIPMSADTPLSGTLPQEFLFLGTGWWPFREKRSPSFGNGAHAALCEIAGSSGYRLRPELELAGGRWCHVLELPGVDRLWLDGERGWAVMARELVQENGELAQRTELAEHREVRPGIWVPMRMRNQTFDDWGKKVVDSILEVQKVRVNEPLPDILFSAPIRPGSIELKKNGDIVQTVPGGTDLLYEIADWSRMHLGFQNGRATPAAKLEGWIETAVGGVCVAFIAITHWRRRTWRSASA